MANAVDARRAYLKQVTGSSLTAVADLEAVYAQQQAAGTAGLASTTTAGVVKKAATVANATDAATVITQLNLLLTNLRAAGVIV
jgi:hypothetical protein